ncbi:MAG: hypothetical protein ACYSTN_06480 [Planctomycetota bacterium]
MNRRQKAIIIKLITITSITAVTVIAMINFKDYINRSEAGRAMEHLGKLVLQYRKEHGGVPPESYVDNIREDLEGHVRLGKLQYRALWIEPESGPNEILAYTEKKYRSFFLNDGFIVLRLDGRVEWMNKPDFDKILAEQQTPMEKAQE